MITTLRWSGAIGPLPWIFFVVLGTASLAAGGVVGAVFSGRAGMLAVGVIEVAGFTVAGLALIGAGIVRRARELRASAYRRSEADRSRGL